MKSGEGKIGKILFLCIRSDFLTNFAGDSKFLLKTADFLSRNGFSVHICRSVDEDLSRCDAVWLFNLTRLTETYAFFTASQKLKKPLLLTPIFWDLSRYYQYSGDTEKLAQWEYDRQFRREILSSCSMVFPASTAEYACLKTDCQTDFPCTIVYSGASEPVQKLPLPREIAARKPYVFCSARICRRKNQLVLCQAAAAVGWNVLLAGKAEDLPYLQQCLALPHVFYLGFLRETALWPVFENAALHVLCSFVETPGLASLEAGLAGTKVLTTKIGSAHEYFQDLAVYCNPYQKDSLSNTLAAALSRPSQPALQQHIRSFFLWENCLQPLLPCLHRLGL